MPELDNEHNIAGVQVRDAEVQAYRTTLTESLRQHLGMYSLAVRAADRIDALEALLREIRDVGLFSCEPVTMEDVGDLEARIAAALTERT
jgi:dsDNA-specific endonuclease/ATPase MutS2